MPFWKGAEGCMATKSVSGGMMKAARVGKAGGDFELVERGALNLPVGETLGLAAASTAHRMLDGAPHKPGKIVLRVAD